MPHHNTNPASKNDATKSLDSSRQSAVVPQSASVKQHPSKNHQQNQQATIQGLSHEQARQKLAQDGPNQIALASHRSLWRRIIDLLKEPMLALLVAAVVIYMVLGDFNESLILGSLVLAVIGLTLYQEGKSQASVEALRHLSQHFSNVKREGVVVKIPSTDIVQGDYLLVAEGDRVAADGDLVQADHLQIDESLLTGESLPVDKTIQDKNALTPAFVNSSWPTSSNAIATSGNSQDAIHSSQVFSGSFVVKGQGIVCVTQTGPRTEIGKIGGSLNQIQNISTPLQKQTQKLVKVIAIITFILCSFMILFMGLQNGNWLAAVLAGIALAMGILPEEYPVVLAIFPAMGAHRLAKQGVITRKITAIETLGAITVLCTDKTGTLTENRMTVNTLAIASKALVNDTITSSAPSSFNATAIAQFLKLSDLKNTPSSKAHHHSSSIPEPFHELAEHAILASAPQAFDPMEVAFHQLGQQYLSQTEHLHQDWQLVKTYPLSSSLRAMSHVWKHSHAEGGYTISAKGAPEAVMSLCHFTAEQIQHWSEVVNEMASQGLRVLAVAKGHYPSTHWPEHEHDFDFKWMGLIGLSDPIRPEIAQAMQDCQTAGIKVLMITGDYPATAKVIAQQAGMQAGNVLSGDELDAFSDEQLAKQLKTTNVCARISPHQKLRIVQVLKASGEVVAMTGDGVNDAPALKAAHVGVAMGARGTDVAREAASLVLVDDNFASIVKGIRLGRRIFKNLQKSMTYIFAIHIPIATIAFLPMLFGVAPILLPLHIALLELIIDPACSLAFENEPEDPAIMQTPPRNPLVAVLASNNIVYAFLQGLMAVVGVGLAYYLATSANFATFATSTFGLDWTRAAADASTPQSIRTMVLIALITTHSLLIWINRAEGRPLFLSRHSPIKNKVALWITAGAWLILLAGIYLPFLARPLALSPLPWPQLASAIACGFVSLIGLLVLRSFKK